MLRNMRHCSRNPGLALLPMLLKIGKRGVVAQSGSLDYAANQSVLFYLGRCGMY